MTMIAFAAYSDHAELITDTTSYTQNGSALGRCTKHLALPHMDAVIATQGDSLFGDYAKMTLWQVAAQVPTFDDFLKAAPRSLRDMWRVAQADSGDFDLGHAFVVLLGYSPNAGRFTAHLFASESDFEGTTVSGSWAYPMPWVARPTDLEHDRMTRRGPLDGDMEKYLGLMSSWTGKAALPDHRGPEEWLHLAKTIREQRALTEYGRVFVAGSVMYTRLEQGRTITAKIHDFDDEGEEFLRMVQWTMHPVAQLMECWCGSSKTYLACHLEPLLDEPCTCGTSAKTFRRCCAVDVDQITDPSYAHR